MPSRLSRFTNRLVTLSKRSVSGDPSPAVKKGDGGYADWVIVVIHGLREYLDLPYRRLLDVLHEMHVIVEKLNLAPSELPDFTTVYARKQNLKMTVWRTLLLYAFARRTFVWGGRRYRWRGKFDVAVVE